MLEYSRILCDIRLYEEKWGPEVALDIRLKSVDVRGLARVLERPAREDTPSANRQHRVSISSAFCQHSGNVDVRGLARVLERPVHRRERVMY